MRFCLAVIFFFLFSFTIHAQIIQSDCNTTPALIQKFRANASKLAVREINYRQPDTTQLSLELDSLLVDTIFNALMTINNSGLGEADTIFNGIKGGGATIVVGPSVRTLRVWAHKPDNAVSNPFYDSLYFKGKFIPSGSSFIDSIFNHYTFTVSDTFSIGKNFELSQFHLTVDRDLNLAPLMKALNELNANSTTAQLGAEDVEGSYINIDYQNLTLSYKRYLGYDEFEFFVGWNDCPSGCQSWRTWKFKTYDGCKVEYVGAQGNYVGIQNIAQDLGYQIYPNPIVTHFTLQGELEKIKTVEIVDSKGTVVSSNCKVQNIAHNLGKVNIENLTKGNYYCRISQAGSYQLIKIIKQ